VKSTPEHFSPHFDPVPIHRVPAVASKPLARYDSVTSLRLVDESGKEIERNLQWQFFTRGMAADLHSGSCNLGCHRRFDGAAVQMLWRTAEVRPGDCTLQNFLCRSPSQFD